MVAFRRLEACVLRSNYNPNLDQIYIFVKGCRRDREWYFEEENVPRLKEKLKEIIKPYTNVIIDVDPRSIVNGNVFLGAVFSLVESMEGKPNIISFANNNRYITNSYNIASNRNLHFKERIPLVEYPRLSA